MAVNLLKKDNNRMMLRHIIRQSMAEKYGLMPEQLISERISREWQAMEQLAMVEHVLLLYRFKQWLDKKHKPYWLKGAGSSSLILYILGIARTNPLPAHYYCPVCRKVEWIDGARDGFDVTDERVCECGTVMTSDGHNLPWQNTWGGPKGYLEFNLPSGITGLITRYYNIFYGWRNYRDIDVLNGEGKKAVRSAKLRFCFTIDERYLGMLLGDFAQRPKELKSRLEFFRLISDELEEQRAIRFAATTFSDILALKGLSMGAGTWDREAKNMLLSGSFTPKDLLAFREDVFSYFLEHSYTEDEAWLALRDVYLGRGVRNIKEGMAEAYDSWKLERCRKINYISSKCAMIEYMLSLYTIYLNTYAGR